MTSLLYNALDAYLGPLLTKHTMGKVLIYNDLTTSYQAAQLVLKREGGGGALRLVSKRVEELHNSQLRAYQEAAQKAIKAYSQECSLLKPESQQEEHQFVQACIQLLESKKPAWNVNESVWNECGLEPFRQRARQQYAAHMQSLQSGEKKEAPANAAADAATGDHHLTSDDNNNATEDSNHDDDDDEEEGDDEVVVMVEEEENDEGEQAAEAAAASTPTTQTAAKKRKKVPVKTKPIVRKTGAATKTNTTVAQRKRRKAGQIARNKRGGGGGGRGAGKQ